ncbi:hypothetical protein [Sphingobacterium sp. SGG-5]|uniref:hypothetical protein n=1 Tax=Sphingobacterium sp. SGG-5 TaxID=2710881 RepID=UPI0019D0C01B|nr:hypothetical protein [Sphingobacterium sp. SGG-5]
MKNPVAIPLIFIWVGFVCAISFMEAWLKFQAPGVTIPIGLGIGRLVFGALNKVEWVLFLGSVWSLFPIKNLFSRQRVFLIVLFIILSIQTFWMLPVLDMRAELFIQGAEVPPSNMHVYFVAVELLKVVALVLLGTSLFGKSTETVSQQAMKVTNLG